MTAAPTDFPRPLTGTGAENYLLGWDLRRFYAREKRLPATVSALGGCVLRGYAACAIAQSQGLSTDDESAMATWVLGAP